MPLPRKPRCRAEPLRQREQPQQHLDPCSIRFKTAQSVRPNGRHVGSHFDRSHAVVKFAFVFNVRQLPGQAKPCDQLNHGLNGQCYYGCQSTNGNESDFDDQIKNGELQQSRHESEDNHCRERSGDQLFLSMQAFSQPAPHFFSLKHSQASCLSTSTSVHTPWQRSSFAQSYQPAVFLPINKPGRLNLETVFPDDSCRFGSV